jgi:hypothetical protein
VFPVGQHRILGAGPRGHVINFRLSIKHMNTERPEVTRKEMRERKEKEEKKKT